LFGIVWIRIRFEAAIYDRRGAVGIHRIEVFVCLIVELCGYVPVFWAGPRMHEFDIVLVEDLLMDDSRVLCLLGGVRAEKA
jgi:hypothetical protein